MSESSIVFQLQELAADPNSNIEELLNKALLVARKLKIKKFRKWCESELEGYERDDVPEYRIIKGQLKVFNPYRGLQPFIIPDSLDRLITTIKIKESVGEINNLLNQEGNSYESVISNEAKSQLMSMQQGFTQLEPRVMFERSQLLSVPSKLRLIILNWSLQLEEDGILGEGMKFSEREKKAAMSVNNFNIQNMQGVVGNISGGTINQNNQMNITKNNFDSLAKFLMEHKVEYSDIQKLEVAIQDDLKPKRNKKLGKHVSEWIAHMMGKAANGSWEIGIASAGTLLAESISKFYGSVPL